MDDNSVNGNLFDHIRQTRRTAGPGKGDGRLRIDDSDAFPCLTHLLSQVPSGAKGSKPGRVGLFVQDGVLTCCLSCPGMIAVAFTAVDGFDRALVEIEGKLKRGELEWKEDKSNKRK